MKTNIQNMAMTAVILTAGIMISCTEEDMPGLENADLPEIGTYTAEVFDPLTVEQFQEIETPFENLISLVSSDAKVQNDGLSDALIEAIMEFMHGATLLGLSEREERGLAVYYIKVLLANGSIIEVSVIKENLEILAISGHGENFDTNIDPEGSFISLFEAMEIAGNAVRGDFARWELSLEEDNIWEYEIHIINETGRYEVEINAFTGEVIAIKLIGEEHEGEFEDEKDETDLPTNIAEKISDHITGEVIHAESVEDGDVTYWKLKVITSSEAIVTLWFKEETAQLVGAGDNEGPFDYDVVFGGDAIYTLGDAMGEVETELDAVMIRWEYEQIEKEGEYYWAIKIKVEDVTGAYHKVYIDAITGTWLKHESEGDEHEEVELPENVRGAVSWYIDATIVHFERHVDGDKVFWKIKVETESDAKVWLMITEGTEDLVAAWDEHGPFDYEVTFGGEGWYTLSQAIGDVEGQFQAETLYWEFEQVEVEEEHYWAIKVKVMDAEEKWHLVYIDAATGNWIKQESQE